MTRNNINIRRVQKAGDHCVVSIPREWNLQPGDFVKITPIVITESIIKTNKKGEEMKHDTSN